MASCEIDLCLCSLLSYLFYFISIQACCAWKNEVFHGFSWICGKSWNRRKNVKRVNFRKISEIWDHSITGQCTINLGKWWFIWKCMSWPWNIFWESKNFNEFHPERKRKKNIFKLRSRFETLFFPSEKFWLFTAFLPFWQNSWPVKASFVIKYSSIPYFCHFLGLEKEKGTTMVCLKKLRKSELCER